MRTSNHRPALAAAAAVTLLSILPAHAANRYWVNSTGPFGVSSATWSNVANWSATSGGTGGATVPGSADTVFINFNDPKNQTILNPTLDITTTIAALNIGSTATGVPTLFQNANYTLTVTGAETLGYQANGHAAYTQSDGTNISTGLLSIGDAAGSRATYSLSGTAALRPGANTYVGNHGAGIFNQTGGTFSTNHALYVAYDAGSTGTYTLQTGSLVTGAETIGYNASAIGSAAGTFLQSGGTHSTSSLYLGYNAGSSGYYALSDPSATLSVGSTTVIGANNSATGTSSGTFSQSAGNFTAGFLTVGSATAGGAATGTFSQSAGSFSAASLTVGSAAPGSTATGIFSLGPDGSLSVTGTAIIGYNSTGTASAAATGSFIQTGGSFSAQNLNVASSLSSAVGGAVGSYSLSAGTLAVSGITTVGNSFDTGSFLQTGGSHTTGSVNINPGSSYTLAGSSASLTAGNADVTGTFVHTGGTLSIDTVDFSGLSIGGTYSLAGTGALIDNGYLLVGGGALYTQSAGTATVGSPSSPQRVIVGLGDADDTDVANFNLSGTAVADIYGTLDLGGTDITDGITGSPGALNITGGTLTIHGPIHLFTPPVGSNSIHIDGGSLSLTSFNGTSANVDVSHGTLSFSSPDPVTLGGTNSPPITVGPGGHLAAASFILAAGLSINLAGGSLDYSNSLTLAGATLTGSSLFSNPSQLSGYGAIAGAGGFSNTGSLSIPAGTFTLSSTGPLSSAGLVTLSSGAQLSLTGSSLTNTGLLQLSPGSKITGTATLVNSPGGVIQGAGTISTPLTNSSGATLLLTTGTLNLTQPTTNAGTLQLLGPASTLAGAALTNTGTLRGDGAVTNPLTNSTTGAIRADTGQSLTLTSMSSPNAGTLNLQGGSLIFSQALTNTGTITGHGGSLTAPSLTNTASILLTGGSTDFHAPITSASGSSITVTTGAGATFFNPVSLQSGSQFRVGPNSTAVFLAAVTGSGQITGSGTKDFEGGASAPSSLDTAGLGSTTVESPASLTTSYLNESSLSLFGSVSLTPNSPASSLASLIINPTGSLNLSNDTLVISSITPDTLRQYLHAGQLFSSSSNTTHTLAYAPVNIQNPAGPWSVSLALTGDINLDGKINADDYALLDRDFAKHISDPHWTDGDFNYDGIINNQDYLLLDTAYLSLNPSAAPSLLASRESQFGQAYVSELLISLPEPSLFGACGLALPLLARRRKLR